MEPGIYEMTREEYEKIDAVNASLLLAGPTMAHRKAYLDGKRETSDALAFGTALHMYILEPDRFKTHYMLYDVPPDRRSAWGKGYWKAVEMEVGDKEAEKRRKQASEDWDVLAERVGADRMLEIGEVETFKAMRDSLHKSARRRALAVTPGKYECVIVWKDKGTGLLMKGMLDKLIEGIECVVDLKRAVRADSFNFGRAANDHGYDVRAAMYLDGLLAITGKRYSYILLPIEPDPPYASAMYEIVFGSDEYRSGRAKYQTTLRGWAHCLKTGEYPDYGNDVLPLSMPKYAYPMELIEEEVSDEPSNDRAHEDASEVLPGAATGGDEEAGVFGVTA